MKTLAYAPLALAILVTPAFAGMNCGSKAYQAQKAPVTTQKTATAASVAKPATDLEVTRMVALLQTPASPSTAQ